MDQTGKYNKTRSLCVAVVLALVFAGILVCVPVVQSKSSQTMQEDVAEDTNGQGQDASTLEPSMEPSVSTSPRPSVKPTKAPVRLEPVSGVDLARYSTHSVKVTWKKHKKAKFYSVYY
ncbi:MAG: hypothetical protein K1W06_06880, partial [Lachnospiraceae bacterium]